MTGLTQLASIGSFRLLTTSPFPFYPPPILSYILYFLLPSLFPFPPGPFSPLSSPLSFPPSLSLSPSSLSPSQLFPNLRQFHFNPLYINVSCRAGMAYLFQLVQSTTNLGHLQYIHVQTSINMSIAYMYCRIMHVNI